MKERFKIALPAPLSTLRDRIEHWRRSRKKRERMPEELWQEAALLSKTYGIYPVARDLGLHYDRLKQRVLGKKPKPKPATSVKSGFIEISGIDCFKETEKDILTELEVSRTDGSKLRIRQTGYTELKLPDLVEAFLRCER